MIMIMIIYIMAYRVEYTLAYTNPLFWFYDEPITGKPLEEHASDLKRSDMTPSPTVADKSLDSGSEMSREKFDLLYYPLEEQLVPQQVTGQVSNDESLRHTLNRSPFNSNGEIVMVSPQMPLIDGDDLVPSLNTGSESTSMLSSHHTLTLHQPPLLYHATGISSDEDCLRGNVTFSPNHSVEALVEDMEYDQLT